MNKICIIAGATVLGYGGWWMGEQMGGMMTAFIVSSIGSLLGVYVGWRVNRDYIE
jgi:hypothetical protein